MSIKKYKFISPGVQINEIDNSALPAAPLAIGPMVIGSTRRGPAMRPIRVSSFSEFIEVFGTPDAGVPPQDSWRNGAGILSSPTYASYAAQAWLQNNSPINIVRLLGEEHAEATSDGYAGWQTTKEAPSSRALEDQGGAYGLFIVASSSKDNIMAAPSDSSDLGVPQTGALAAIFYADSGSYVRLSGIFRTEGSTGNNGHTTSTASLGALIYSNGANHSFTAEIVSGSGEGTVEKINFNFDRNDPNYIRKVFNTNPASCNANVTKAAKSVWLGETFDQFLEDTVGTGGTQAVQGKSIGVILSLSNNVLSYGNRRFAHRAAQSGWIISQHLGTATDFVAASQTKLFKIHSRAAGMYEMHNLKVSIEDIRPPKNDSNPFSTFTLSLRLLSDNDGKIKEVERYTNLDLNPNSSNYIANRIGDKYVEFDDVERRNKEYGIFDNASEFIRVEMHPDIEDSGPPDPQMVPFGFFGPPRFKGFSLAGPGTEGEFKVFGASHMAGADAATNFSSSAVTGLPVRPNSKDVHHGVSSNSDDGDRHKQITGSLNYTASFLFPTIALRVSSSDNPLPSAATAFHGLRTHRSASSLHDESMVDLLRSLPDRLLNTVGAEAMFADYNSLQANLEIPIVFSLDDVHSASSDATTDKSGHAYSAGCRAREESISADTTGHTKGAVTKKGWEATVLYGADSFTFPLFGGTNGLNIKEKDPFGHHVLAGATETTSYAYNTVKQAIDICSDIEDVEFNIATAPNIKEPTLTQRLLDTCEDRADALAIIDLEHDYKPAAETTDGFKARLGDVNNAVKTLRDRNLDSSFAAAYYPYVQILDRLSNLKVFVPPSVIALGVMSNSEAISNVWFAPAGFSRGGLSTGAAGIPVLNVTQKLSKKDRDDLYDVNINPIASFPSEGIVVFGQKTLQATPSALDRINVRRLLIFLKKRISRIANGILFDQNARVTWNRFTGEVEPFLRGVKAGLGLSEYKIILDETTTTPELQDRNTLYAKIFLKPTKSIEFIAIDFNITNQGAAFDD